MNREGKIPTLNPTNMTGFHSHTIDWKPVLSNTKHPFFHINRLEAVVDQLNFPLPPHRKSLYDFLLLKKGTSIRSKGLNRYEFGESSMFFLPAYQITQHEMMSPDTEGFFCHFDDKIFEFLPKNYLSDNYPFFQFQTNPVVTLSTDSNKSVTTILERLFLIYSEDKGMDKLLISAYLLALFEEVRRELLPKNHKKKNAFFQITQQYKNALVKQIYQKQSVTNYAHILNITPNYLNKCVISSTNKTAQELLNEMLILEAKTLLKYSNLQIAEVAVKLRNQTPSNFARFFKCQTGITPKEYLELE
jgi:AraC-like DNA-binding protein